MHVELVLGYIGIRDRGRLGFRFKAWLRFKFGLGLGLGRRGRRDRRLRCSFLGRGGCRDFKGHVFVPDGLVIRSVRVLFLVRGTWAAVLGSVLARLGNAPADIQRTRRLTEPITLLGTLR